MAELVDAYVSGAYARKGVGVRLPLPALNKAIRIGSLFLFSDRIWLAVTQFFRIAAADIHSTQ